ncbi:MAG: inositol monophosphatase [Bosea sp. 67-29]|nr:MAG: inositol monophosphatase [Bosea sp. 67-29]
MGARGILLETTMSAEPDQKQLLHLVFGGELDSLDGITFKDLSKLDIVGVFPNYASAHMAWKAKAQQTVDQAQTRYFIVHLHRLLDPETAKG